MKNPSMVRNITALAVTTRPQAPPSIMVVTVVLLITGLGVVVTVEFGPGGGSGEVPGARARTMGRAKADTTMPVVRNQASSRQGLELESSLWRLASRVGMGDRR